MDSENLPESVAVEIIDLLTPRLEKGASSESVLTGLCLAMLAMMKAARAPELDEAQRIAKSPDFAWLLLASRSFSMSQARKKRLLT
jgi:hypothetical protein